jgi:hypothetical protein
MCSIVFKLLISSDVNDNAFILHLVIDGVRIHPGYVLAIDGLMIGWGVLYCCMFLSVYDGHNLLKIVKRS